jgi:GNAT superfamily N-acetyltransferase
MNLDTFLATDGLRNSWIKERDIEIYVRKSVRLIGSETYPCLDIGSVEVREKHRGQGVFTAFLYRFEQEAKKLGRGVYIESILNLRLKTYLLTKGYKLVPRTCDMSPSVYKLDFP